MSTHPHRAASSHSIGAMATVAAFAFAGAMILARAAFDIIPEAQTAHALRLWVGAAFAATLIYAALSDTKRGGIRFLRLGSWRITISRKG